MKQRKNIFENNRGRIINSIFLTLLVAGITLLIIKNWDQFVNYKELLKNIPISYLLIILLITINATLMRTWRWYYLLVPLKPGVSWRNVMRVTINALAAHKHWRI